MRSVEDRLQALEQRTRGIPARFAGGAAVPVLPWVSLLVSGGNTLITSPADVYGIKRYLGEAMPTEWIYTARRATVTASLSGGGIGTLTVGDTGTGYTVAPTVAVSAPPGGGTQAVVTASLAASTNPVAGAWVTACGSGYTYATVAIAAPSSGVTATAVAVLRDGKVVGITIVNGGSGYVSTSLPAITITGDGSGATATAAVDPSGGLSFAITTAGTGYLVAPVCTVPLPDTTFTPMPPTIADPSPSDWADGVGWGTIIGGSLTGGVTAGPALVCHDDRGMVAYGLMGEGAGVSVPYARAPDSILSWYLTRLRLTIADADADGVLPAWVPMAGGV